MRPHRNGLTPLLFITATLLLHWSPSPTPCVKALWPIFSNRPFRYHLHCSGNTSQCWKTRLFGVCYLPISAYRCRMLWLHRLLWFLLWSQDGLRIKLQGTLTMAYYSAMKRRKSYYLQQHGQTKMVECWLKQVWLRKTNTMQSPLYMWNLKDETNERTKQRQTHRFKEQTDGYHIGGA